MSRSMTSRLGDRRRRRRTIVPGVQLQVGAPPRGGGAEHDDVLDRGAVGELVAQQLEALGVVTRTRTLQSSRM